jgi:hypothetical protein
VEVRAPAVPLIHVCLSISWDARVQGDQQIQALLLPDFTDHNPLRAHPQGLPDEMAEADLACSFQVRLPGLHSHHIGQWHLNEVDKGRSLRRLSCEEQGQRHSRGR